MDYLGFVRRNHLNDVSFKSVPDFCGHYFIAVEILIIFWSYFMFRKWYNQLDFLCDYKRLTKSSYIGMNKRLTSSKNFSCTIFCFFFLDGERIFQFFPSLGENENLNLFRSRIFFSKI